MAASGGGDDHAGAGTFNTTHWSVVLAAGRTESPGSMAALENLCQTYWYPLYTFVRRKGHSHEDAQDLTQEFFARLLGKNYVANAKMERGKFRTFLLASLKNFMVNKWMRANRLKRGGANAFVSLDAECANERYEAEPRKEEMAESLYERQWAVALVQQVFAVLQREYTSMKRQMLLNELKGFVLGEKDSASYVEIGAKLQMTEGAVKVAVHRLRQRFRELLREEVAQTVSRPEDVDGELRHLIGVLS